MTGRLYADFGVISGASVGLRSAAATLPGWSSLFSAGLGSTAVQAALDTVSSIHAARATAARAMLESTSVTVEHAVSEMIEADQSFVRTLP